MRRAATVVVGWVRGLRPAAPQPPAGLRPPAPLVRVAGELSAAVTALMAASSAAGAWWPGLYRDPPAVVAMFRAYDLVTLTVATPLLAGARLRARQGSPRAQLLWAGMLAYAVYQYAYYVFGAAVNPLFPVHVTVFVLAGVTLTVLLRGLDVPHVAAEFGPRTPRRAVSGVLAVLAAGLGGMWIGNSVRSALTGTPLPDGLLVQPPAMLRLGYVMDLTTLVPGYATAAALLWRRHPWGGVLATVLLTASAPVQLAYMAALPAQVAAGVPGATAFDPQEPWIAALITAAAAAMLGGLPRYRAALRRTA